MKLYKLATLLLTTALLCSILPLTILPTVKAASTIHVPADWATIGQAIAHANPGDTILVAAGTYHEEVVISKSLKIIGAGAATTVIDGTGVILGSDGLVKIAALGDVTFSGFTVQNIPLCAPTADAFGIFSKSSVLGVTYTISNNRIIGTSDTNPAHMEVGFYSQNDAANVVFKYNNITNIGGNNICFEVHTGATEISHNILGAALGLAGDAIFFMTYNGHDVSALQNVSYNTIDMGRGTTFDYAHRSTGITISTPGAAYGVGDAKYTNVLIEWNTIYNLQSYRRGIGFWIGGTGANIVSPVVTGNTITGVGSPVGSYGISFVGSGDVIGATLTLNTITGTEYAIYLRSGDASGAKINYNNIAGNTNGLSWIGGSLADARFNWWGSATGPSPPGSGEPVTGNADISHWLTSPFNARLYTSPKPVSKTYADVGTNFDLDVKIANITDLYGFDIKLTWNNSLITFVQCSYSSTFDALWGAGNWWLQQSGTGVVGGMGYYRIVVVAEHPAVGFTGSSTLFTLTFHIVTGSNIATLQTPIHFEIAKLSNSLYTSIPATVEDGLYQITFNKPDLEFQLFNPNPAKPFEYCKTFKVQVYVTNVTSQLTGYNITVVYDPELFRLTGVEFNGTVLGGTYTESPIGTVKVLKTGGTAYTGASGLLFTLVFHVQFDDRYTHIWRTLGPNTLTRNISFFDAYLIFTEGTLPMSGITMGAALPITVHLIQGDVTCDGKVNVADLQTVAHFYDVSQGSPQWGSAAKYDLNLDGTIDVYDLVVVSSNFGYNDP